MLKLMKADIYKSFRRPYLYVLTAILCALVVIYNLMFINNVPREVSFTYTLQFVVCLPFFAVMLVDIVMAEEIKFGTLKNSITSGIDRSCLFVSKSITSIILTTICAAFTFLFFYVSSCLLMRPGKDYTPAFLTDYMLRIGVVMLLIFGALVFAMFMAVICRKNAVYAFAFAGIMFVPGIVFKALSFSVSPFFQYFYEATILGQCYELKTIPQGQLFVPAVVALVHILVFGIAGIVIFKRQEIN